MNDQKIYRVEYGKVYELCEKSNAYIFIGCLNGQSLKEFLEDYSLGEF